MSEARYEHFTTEITKAVSVPYHLHLPPNHDPNAAEKYPLILFLHGLGERGDDPTKIKIYGMPFVTWRDESFPFITVSPVCPLDRMWSGYVDEVMALLADCIGRYNADPKRIYLTGLSMGGNGVWALALRYPDRFAALAPICGWGDESQVHRLKDKPIWMVHGELDKIVPVEESEKLYRELMSYGAPHVTYMTYSHTGHNVWDEAYDNPDLYTWLLSHQLP